MERVEFGNGLRSHIAREPEPKLAEASFGPAPKPVPAPEPPETSIDPDEVTCTPAVILISPPHPTAVARADSRPPD